MVTKRFGMVFVSSLCLLANPGDQDWPVYGGNVEGWHYTSDAQLTPETIGKLKFKWSKPIDLFNGPQKITEEVPGDGGKVKKRHVSPGNVNDTMQATPIVYQGMMFVPTWHDLYAFDAQIGTLKWTIPLSTLNNNDAWGTRRMCCGLENRGVAVENGILYVATLDAHLMAFKDLNNPQPSLIFNRNLLEWLPKTEWINYSVTAAPTVFKGTVVIGVAGSENGARGFVSGVDGLSKDGDVKWRFCTVASGDPSCPAPGGAAPWMTPTIYSRRGLIVFGTGNPYPDFDGGSRPGDNLYANSIVFLDLDGVYKYHFQEVHHDLWDYDQSSPPVVTDLGKVGAAGKTGWWYWFDGEQVADSGLDPKLFTPTEKNVPQDAGQKTSPTQPWLDDKFSFLNPYLRRFADGGDSPHDNMFSPPTTAGVCISPGMSGGAEWGPVTYNPTTQRIYVVDHENPNLFQTSSAPHTNNACDTLNQYDHSFIRVINSETGEVVSIPAACPTKW